MMATEFALKKIPVRVNSIAPVSFFADKTWCFSRTIQGVYASEMTFDHIPPELVDKIGKGVSPVPAERDGT
jgi:squamous cell carcinoma antigen recognized by T-cells 3